MVRTYTFDGSLGARPGQFVMVWLPGVDEVPMSVAYDDGAETKITFFAVGDMTEELAKCEVWPVDTVQRLCTSWQRRPLAMDAHWK